MFNGLAKIFKRSQRSFEVFQIEASSYRSPEGETRPRAIFAEQWIFQNMSMETFQGIEKYLPLTQWVFFGGWGDPLENRHLVWMLRRAKQAQCLIRLTTNGTLLSDELSQQLLSEGLDTLIVDLDGAVRTVPESLQGGSELKGILDNIQRLLSLRRRAKQSEPQIVLSFLMTRLNMMELPQMVPLAAQIGVDGLNFTHLDYLPNERCNLLRVFYHESKTPVFEEKVTEIEELGKKYKITVRTPQLQAKEVTVCEPNPLRRVFFAVDGTVAPCPYLRLPKKGDIPRIFLHKRYTVPQKPFGKITEEDFLEIWNKEAFQEFRRVFEERKKREGNVVSFLSAFSDGRASRAEEFLPDPPPLSQVCQTCYKAYGI